MEKGKLINNW